MDATRRRRVSQGPRIGTGTCFECGKPGSAHIEDFGIGPYEYWGAKGVHHDYQPVSDCCEAEVDGFEEREPDYD